MYMRRTDEYKNIACCTKGHGSLQREGTGIMRHLFTKIIVVFLLAVPLGVINAQTNPSVQQIEAAYVEVVRSIEEICKAFETVTSDLRNATSTTDIVRSLDTLCDVYPLLMDTFHKKMGYCTQLLGRKPDLAGDPRFQNVRQRLKTSSAAMVNAIANLPMEYTFDLEVQRVSNRMRSLIK